MSNVANKLLEIIGAQSVSLFQQKYELGERIRRRLSMESKSNGSSKHKLAFMVVDRPNISKALKDFKKGYKIFVTPQNLQLFDVMKEIRQMITHDQTVSIYLAAGATVLNPTTNMGELYDKLKEPDGFMYVSVKESNFF